VRPRNYILFELNLYIKASCIKENIKWDKDKRMEDIIITSDAFRYGDDIPGHYTCEGSNISPPLSWNIVPEAKSYVLIMEDPDAPGGVFIHWVLYNVPSYIHILPSGIPKDLRAWPFGFQGITDFGAIGYGGPCPPPGKHHRYFFRIYALDTWLNLPPGAYKRDVEKVMTNHIIAKGELMGLYTR